MNNDYFDDERINLNVEIPCNVLAIADLGLWYGVDATPLLNALYNGKATHEMVLRDTRSLRPYVSKVYGWGGRQPKAVA